MGLSTEFWSGKRVLLTGHTGFKGAWAMHWLKSLGADVHGLALAPATRPSLFEVLYGQPTAEEIVDLRDRGAVARRVREVQPQVVVHMAAQAIVMEGYKTPVETFATNVLGTAHLLDALREVDGLLSVVVVTSDKAYENDDRGRPFAENDPVGGSDPYSASKGCQEIVAQSYRRSFFQQKGIPVVTARAGNVIGGGDWAEDRLMTDALAALVAKRNIVLRNPLATRPWQHVLEPVAGYLLYAQVSAEGLIDVPSLNFGPDDSATVQDVTERLLKLWQVPGLTWEQDAASHPKEAHALALTAQKARAVLGWQPRLDLDTTLGWIVDWHKAFEQGQDMSAVTAQQIEHYQRLMDEE
jgi:CDP-glucose 4,6-dehydratase